MKRGAIVSKGRLSPIAPGQRVAYSRSFLNSTGSSYYGAQRRGTFIRMAEGKEGSAFNGLLAYVKWDDEEGEEHGVLRTNIATLGSVAFVD